MNMELNLKKESQKNLESSRKIKDISQIYKSNYPNMPNIDELKEKYKNPYKSPLKMEKNKIIKNSNTPLVN